MDEDRKVAHKDFNVIVADQRATHNISTDSLNILKAFYDKCAFTKFHDETGPRQQEGFNEYKGNENSSGVMGMMQDVIDCPKESGVETIYDEQHVQREHDVIVMDSNRLIDDKTCALVNQKEVKAETERTKFEADVIRGEVQDALNTLHDEVHIHHTDYDSRVESWETRATMRDEEDQEIDAPKELVESGLKLIPEARQSLDDLKLLRQDVPILWHS